DGSLVICDAHRGLLRLTAEGSLVELVTTTAGRPLTVCNNAAVARDGTVYFTDSSDRYPLPHWKRDLLEYRPNGRLLAHDPDSGRTRRCAGSSPCCPTACSRSRAGTAWSPWWTATAGCCAPCTARAARTR